MLSSRSVSLNADIDVPQSILNAKTPGRKALKGRSALQENALHNGAKTVLSKKNILQTPFRPGTAHGKKPLVSISLTRPLMDKTPFPNRVAAANFAGPAGKTPGLKLSKLALLAAAEPQHESLSPDAAPLLRPSSARKSLRGRLSGSNFKTPLTKGNYWDVSPGDMEGIGGVVEEVKDETELAVDDEDDEIEYMAPTAVEPPYEPPFEIPDYKAMGRTLFQLSHAGLMDDTADAFYAQDIEQQIDVKQLLADSGFNLDSFPDGLELPELEDDSPFAPRHAKPHPDSAHPPHSQSKPSASKSTSAVPLVRPSSTRIAPSSRLQPTATAPPRPATTTPPNQSRPPSSSRLAQPTVVPAPGQTRTSALRAAKATAAAAASAAAAAPNAVRPVRRPVASASSTTVGTAVQARSSIVKSATTGAVAAKAGPGAVARSRSATTLGKKAIGPSPSSAGKSGGWAEDALAAALERAYATGGGGEEDFRFGV